MHDRDQLQLSKYQNIFIWVDHEWMISYINVQLVRICSAPYDENILIFKKTFPINSGSVKPKTGGKPTMWLGSFMLFLYVDPQYV